MATGGIGFALMTSKIFPNPADPPDPRPQGRGLNMGLPFLAVAAQSMPSLEEGQRQSLKLIAEEIVKKWPAPHFLVQG